MKRNLIIALLLVSMLLSLCGCGTNFGSLKENTLQIPEKHGALGEFSLSAPAADESVFQIPTFKWEAAENAAYYTFEICSSTVFSTVDNMGNTVDVYVKKSGLTETQIQPVADIRQKDSIYYWRVTAHNDDGSKICTGDYRMFYLAVPDVDSIDISINNADDWVRHTAGSYADISINRDNFFGNNSNALTISFVMEDTKQETAESVTSDGWLCVTKTVEADFYGVDAFKFNFYYSGHDSRVMLRVVDQDNEYWQAEVQIAGNNKQTVIIPFDEFKLRTSGGTTIANQKFDYNYIKTIDFTFEQTFGDGVAVISDLKAVKFEDYAHMFIDKFDFTQYSESDFVYNSSEKTTFTPVVKDNGDTLELNFSGNNGYAFARLPINAFLSSGDALKMTLNYSGGYKSTAAIVLRLIEEDGDRWSYTQEAALCGEEGITVIVPFSAFTLSEASADGARQFAYIKQLQFGFSGGVYGSGTLTFSDVEVVTLAEEIENLYTREVGSDGIVENFESYENPVQAYYKWQMSNTNKDEAIGMSSIGMFSFGNGAYGVFGYKSDMGPAAYGMSLTVPEGFTALTFNAKDNSTLNDQFSHLTSAPAKLTVTLKHVTGASYSYTVDAVAGKWTNYTIALSDFTRSGQASNLNSQDIVGIQLEMQYYYYDQNGGASPAYSPKNQVFIDDIRFLTEGQTAQKAASAEAKPSDENSKLAVVETFEGSIDGVWSNGTLAASHSVGQALGLSLASGKAQTTMLLQAADTVQANALSLDLKGNGKTTVTIQITFVQAGKEYTVQAILYNVGQWSRYVIGWDHFKLVGTGNVSLNRNNIKNITSITVIAESADAQAADVLLIDNLKLDGTVSGATRTETTL